MSTPGGRILNVDDTEAARYAKTRTLRRMGFEVIEAETGQEALDHVKEWKPDLVLLDVRLPDIHGFEVCRRIKEEQPDVLVLQTSATFTDKEHRVQGLEGGADSYLTEPVEPEELVAAVRALLRMRRAERAQRESEERLRLAVEATGLGIWDFDLASDKLICSDRCLALLGLPTDVEMSYKLFLASVHPADREKTHEAVQRALDPARMDLYAAEYRVANAEHGTERWLAANGRASFVDGRTVRLTGTLLDITERKRWERQQRLLLAELSHRVKNTLAVVQSIASQTLRLSSSPEAFVKSFKGRLQAVSAAHGLLTQHRWESASLKTVVRQSLRSLAGPEREAVTVRGAELMLSPRQTLGLTMVLHELATNATKYGALSKSSGRVDVQWVLEREVQDSARLRLEWRERGGPPVDKPRREGFGMKLINRTVSYDLEGSVSLNFRPEGLECELVIPWGEMSAAPLA